MPLDFPSSPAINDTWTGANGVTYAWDGTKWVAGGASMPYVAKAGDTMTGALTLPGNASSALQAVPLQQVPVASSTTPAMDGTATIGAGTTWARADHIHPTDTSRASVASVTAAAAAAANNVGRNLIHNALFNIQQRGAGVWNTNSYTADRWLLGFGGGTASVAVITAGDPDRAQIGDESANYALRIVYAGGSAAGDATQLMQRIENVRRLTGVTVTLSFWARVISGATALGISITQNFGAGGSAPVNLLVGTATLTSTWQRFSFQRTMPSASGKTLGTVATDHVQLAFNPSSGSTNAAVLGVGVQSGTTDIWGVQLEIGSVATPLENVPWEVDIAHCQRFYETGQAVFYCAYANAASQAFGQTITLQTFKRATPVIAATSAWTYSNASGGAFGNPTQMGFSVFAFSAAAGGNIYAFANFSASAEL